VVGTTVVRDAQFAAEPDGRLRSRQIWVGRRLAAGLDLIRPTSLATIMDHVEPQAAAIMRRPGAPKHAALVLNQQPCDAPRRPLMCEKLLPHILPAGSTLAVYLSDGTSTRFYKTYTGTGRDIA
jgi:hypothetical protein